MTNTGDSSSLRVKLLADSILSTELNGEEIRTCVLTCVEILARMIAVLPEENREKGFQDIHNILKDVQETMVVHTKPPTHDGNQTIH